MWKARTEEIPSGKRIRLLQDHVPLSFRQLFSLFESSSEFCRWYSQTLASCGLEAFFWEHPPISTETYDHEAEFVLIEAPSLLDIRPESTAFDSEFSDEPHADVISFPNLGGDALLIVPRPITSLEAYPHLGAFLRLAPELQVASLWSRTASAVRESLGPSPRWLSTAGLGVPWLHIRLDSRPKYYRFGPYTDAAGQPGGRREPE